MTVYSVKSSLHIIAYSTVFPAMTYAFGCFDVNSNNSGKELIRALQPCRIIVYSNKISARKITYSVSLRSKVLPAMTRAFGCLHFNSNISGMEPMRALHLTVALLFSALRPRYVSCL